MSLRGLCKSFSQHFIACFSRIVVYPYYHIVSRHFTSIYKIHKFTHTLQAIFMQAKFLAK